MSSELDILKKATTAKEKSVKTDMIEDIKDKEDKDIWTVIKSRLSRRRKKKNNVLLIFCSHIKHIFLKIHF